MDWMSGVHLSELQKMVSTNKSWTGIGFYMELTISRKKKTVEELLS
jgi:hypothetical protein